MNHIPNAWMASPPGHVFWQVTPDAMHHVTQSMDWARSCAAVFITAKQSMQVSALHSGYLVR